jgi:hypothetical protein
MRHIFRRDAAFGPEHSKIIKQIGAFLHHPLRPASDRLDHRLHGLLADFLGDLAPTALEQPGGRRLTW